MRRLSRSGMGKGRLSSQTSFFVALLRRKAPLHVLRFEERPDRLSSACLRKRRASAARSYPAARLSVRNDPKPGRSSAGIPFRRSSVFRCRRRGVADRSLSTLRYGVLQSVRSHRKTRMYACLGDSRPGQNRSIRVRTVDRRPHHGLYPELEYRLRKDVSFRRSGTVYAMGCR